MIKASTILFAGAAGLAVIATARSAELSNEVQRVESYRTIGSTSVTLSYPTVSVQDRDGWIEFLKVGETWGNTASETASITFNKDLQVNGNWIPAGTYDMALYLASENDLHVVFNRPRDSAERIKGKRREALRLSVLATTASYVDQFQIDIERLADDDRRPVEGEADPEDEREAGAEEVEENPDEQEADEEDSDEERVALAFHWGARRALLRLEMTGMRWKSTPPPEIPEQIREPWAVVLSSLEALIAEDLEEHIANFAEDFESDFDDGGSAAAHAQLLGHLRRAGLLEGMALSLEELEWTTDESTVEFKNIVAYSTVGRLVFSYKVRNTGGGWKTISVGAE